MRNWIRFAFIALGSIGCLPTYSVPRLKPTAEFSVTAESDASATTARNIIVWVYKNEECDRHEYGMRAGSKFENSSVISTDPTPIAAGERFVFTGYYIDARFAQNRACAATGIFTPQVNHHYRALLVVSGNVTTCRLGVYDTTSGDDEDVAISMPTYVCDSEGKTARLNGRPLWRNWQLPVLRY